MIGDPFAALERVRLEPKTKREMQRDLWRVTPFDLVLVQFWRALDWREMFPHG